MSEKCKSASLSAIQMKNRLKKIGIKEKLYVVSWLEKVNMLLQYAIVLDLLMLAYVQ